MSALDDGPSDTLPVAPLDDQIRLVRLITGEDILCVMHDDIEKGSWQPMDHIMLSTPVKLIMHRMHPLRPASAMAIGIMQWIPDELLDCHAVVVRIGHIVTVMEPKEELKTYYKKTVDLIHMNLISGDRAIRTDILKASNDCTSVLKESPAVPPIEVPKAEKSTFDALNDQRMHELMYRLQELDDYLMASDNDEDGPITYH